MNKYILLLTYITASFCENVINGTESFTPTHEWQVIKKGQTIPKGLHVRLNLSSGIREAKLLDNNEQTNRALSVVDNADKKKETNITLNSIEHALKNIKNDDNPPNEARVKQKFRSLDELKKNLQQFDLAYKSESDIISNLLARYKELEESNEDKTTRVLRILEDLEYLVHNYDNGLEFIKLRGVEIIILPNIRNSSDNVTIQTLEVLGACMQNNQNVQRIIFNYNVGKQLLELIEMGSNKVKSKAIYALGCLTRRYPEAQEKLIITNGNAILSKILNDFEEPDMKVKLRIVTLLHDLVLESQEHSGTVSYDELLENLNFCKNLGRLIIFNYKYFLKEHDYTEKLLAALNTTMSTCKDEMTDNSFIKAMHGLVNVYSNLAREEQENSELKDGGYFTNILSLLGKLTNNLKTYDKHEL